MKSVSEFAPTTVLCLHSFRGCRHGRNLYPKHLNVTCLYREWQDLKDKNSASLSDCIGKASAPPSGVKRHSSFSHFPTSGFFQDASVPFCGAFSTALWCGDVDPIYRFALGYGYQGFPFISYGFPNITYKNFASDIAGIKEAFTLKQGFLTRVCIKSLGGLVKHRIPGPPLFLV